MIYLVSVKVKQTELYAIEADSEMEALGKLSKDSVPIECDITKRKAEVLLPLTEEQFMSYGKSKFPSEWQEDLIKLMVER